MVSSARVRWRVRSPRGAARGHLPGRVRRRRSRARRARGPASRRGIGVRTRPTRRPRRRPSGWVSPRDGDRPPSELDRAARLTGRLSLPELAGQVIVADYRGTAAPVDLVRRLHLAGVIAFADNVSSAQQVRAANLRLRRAAAPAARGLRRPGGRHRRAGPRRAHPLPAFMSAGAADDPALTTSTYAASAAELARAGFTMDFAPVADVTSGPGDPTIGSRSVGSRARRGGRARGGRRAWAARCRHRPGGQALPRSRVGARRQPRDPARAEAVAA